jgi:hypothetical protein
VLGEDVDGIFLQVIGRFGKVAVQNHEKENV